MSSDFASQPWYKNPMVWLVIFFPVLAVVGGIITIMIAMNTEDGLVVDDYYKKGLEINQVIDHDLKAKELGLSALTSINTQSGEITVSLTSISELPETEQLSIRLIHRTRSGQDQQTMLNQSAEQFEYSGYFRPPIIPGLWTLEISLPEQWRLKKSFTNSTSDTLIIKLDA